jgi:phosphonate transport system substrate-binding protein
MIASMRHHWKRITVYCLLITVLAACNLPTAAPAPTRTPTATVTPAEGETTATPTDVPTVVPELGEEGNPILLALPPSQVPDQVAISNGQTLATMLEEITGYRIVAVAPTTHTDLIEAMRIGNAHIAVLPPFAIVQAYDRQAVTAAFAATRDEVASYGAQFIARSDRFTAYFDPLAGQNFAAADKALAQFSGKTPCWSKPDSESGYLVPAGILGWYKIPTQEGAFLQSQFSVVRAVIMGGVCDFGGTYIDAREYPALKDEYPHIMDEVVVIWQVPPIIPYEGIFLSPTLPDDMATNLRVALDLVFVSDSGKTLFETLYGIKGLVPAQDDFYVEFTRYLLSSGADLSGLVR